MGSWQQAAHTGFFLLAVVMQLAVLARSALPAVFAVLEVARPAGCRPLLALHAVHAVFALHVVLAVLAMLVERAVVHAAFPLLGLQSEPALLEEHAEPALLGLPAEAPVLHALLAQHGVLVSAVIHSVLPVHAHQAACDAAVAEQPAGLVLPAPTPAATPAVPEAAVTMVLMASALQ